MYQSLIETAAEHFGYQKGQVEKDYWISKVLKELVSVPEYQGKIFFKGGTSLSKAYHIIERFSEDLDLFVFTGNLTDSQEKQKQLNGNIYNHIKEQYNNHIKEELGLRGGNFNKIVIDYRPMFTNNKLKDSLEVEIKSCGLKDKRIMYYPSDVITVQSLIGEHLNLMDRQDVAEKYGLDGFEVNCLNPKKTICDKISRMTRISYSSKPIESFAKHIRDIYDLHKILQTEEGYKFIRSRDFLNGMYSVWVEDMKDRMARTHLPLSKTVIFCNPNRILNEKQIKTAYNTDLKGLMFEQDKMPTLKEIESSMIIYGQCLRQFDRYRDAKTGASRNRISDVEFSTKTNEDGKEKTMIRCRIDGILQDFKDSSFDDAQLVKDGLLYPDMAGFKWYCDTMGDPNLSYEKEPPKNLMDKDRLINIASRMTLFQVPAEALTPEENEAVKRHFDSFYSIGEKEQELNEIWAAAEKLPQTRTAARWLADAKDCFYQIAGLQKENDLKHGLKL